MAPTRGLIVKDVATPQRDFRADTIVWVHDRAGARVDIEYKSRFYVIPADAVVPVPVPAPPDAALLALDPCFLSPESAFEAVHRSENYFRLLRCRAHGRIFLEDYRGGIAEYRRLIFIQEPDAPPERLWEKYHHYSDDWLNYQGIAR